MEYILQSATSQFYRVTTDNHFPFRIYAAQQDNSTIRIAHRTDGRSITEDDWEPTAGGESAHIAIDLQITTLYTVGVTTGI